MDVVLVDHEQDVIRMRCSFHEAGEAVAVATSASIKTSYPIVLRVVARRRTHSRCWSEVQAYETKMVMVHSPDHPAGVAIDMHTVSRRPGPCASDDRYETHLMAGPFYVRAATHPASWSLVVMQFRERNDSAHTSHFDESDDQFLA